MKAARKCGRRKEGQPNTLISEVKKKKKVSRLRVANKALRALSSEHTRFYVTPELPRRRITIVEAGTGHRLLQSVPREKKAVSRRALLSFTSELYGVTEYTSCSGYSPLPSFTVVGAWKYLSGRRHRRFSFWFCSARLRFVSPDEMGLRPVGKKDESKFV